MIGAEAAAMNAHLLLLFAAICGAAVVPFLSRRIGVPSAALEIIYGIVLFNTLASRQPDWFLLLKELGIFYLMFIVGMELDLKQLAKGGRMLWYALIPALSLTMTPLLFERLGLPFFLGIAVAVFSAGIIIPVLKEEDLLRSPWGRDIIGVALTGEFLSIAVLTGIDVSLSHGWSLNTVLHGLNLLLLTVLAALFLKLLYLAAWWFPERVEKVMESEDPVEEGIRAVISVAFAGALLASFAGIEPVLGSFMAGLAFSLVFKSKGRFEDKVNAVGFGFFTPFFFIGVGASFDLSLLTSATAVLLALLLTIMVFISNLYPIVFGRFMGRTFAESLGTALVLSAPLSLMIVAGTLGVRMGLLSSRMNSILVLTAVLSGVLYPFLFRVLLRGVKRTGGETLSSNGDKPALPAR